MNAILLAASLVCGFCVALFVPESGPSAVMLGAVLAMLVGYLISKAGHESKVFLLQLFVAGLLVRVLVGTAIFSFGMQEFFGGDAITYDFLGQQMIRIWQAGELYHASLGQMDSGWGMAYMVGVVYSILGRNMLAVQYVNAVLGAATAPVIFLCAQHIFHNTRVARLSAFFVAFYPSLVLWSSQGLKDGPLVFLLAVAMLATLRLGERLSVKMVGALALALFGILSLRFYVFYMMTAAIGGAFVIGMKALTARSIASQATVMIAVGLLMTYMGVLRYAPRQLETYVNLQTIQTSRADLAQRADSGFGKDVDVSTTGGALATIPLGMVYLLFAPFPWQLASLRQSITLPEMLVWWASFPLLALGAWFTLKYRLRQAMPILIFTTMLTIAYSIFQGNIGTAYRQRSQLLVFYFIFASVGFVLLKEKQEDRQREAAASRRTAQQAAALAVAQRKKMNEWENIAEHLSEKVGF